VMMLTRTGYRAVTCDDVDEGLVIGQLPVMMLKRDWL